ncbi:ethanolamine utilization polyhedral-body-like protein EutK [Klebsiella oxytoca]|nr:ethanolamine utilization protein EutK [Klebsiella oxytoca MGH 28]SAP90429.1 ethanolamine utilization polyhedral-body-like protein EutK [Klebsiella oxytoca]
MPLPMPFWILSVIQSSARKGEAMINALGLLEVDGMVAAVDAADAMLKAANVRLLSHEVLDPGRLTLVVEGDLAACRAALDAGSAAAQRTGRVVSRREIGRPEEDTQRLIGGFQPQPEAPQPPVIAESSEPLLALLASTRQGMTAGEVAAHFGWSLDEARKALEQLFSTGSLRKRSSRYRLKN